MEATHFYSRIFGEHEAQVTRPLALRLATQTDNNLLIITVTALSDCKHKQSTNNDSNSPQLTGTQLITADVKILPFFQFASFICPFDLGRDVWNHPVLHLSLSNRSFEKGIVLFSRQVRGGPTLAAVFVTLA
ncbi:hypothetical protein AVEN_73124-1 [Araneus ventricosus]|uniref:Uncharacterized protein n=1 Tax=Araneus ventricosus TaxID=182803 RepID=A0A4Y2RQP7_ARAVE|nr:hypothetical protein AVEN_73124-1 [Araneus ventricosus]